MPLLQPWPFNVRMNKLTYKIASYTIISAVKCTNHIFYNWFTKVEVKNRERLENAVFNRSPSQCLITYSNHHSCIDDPFIFGMIPTRRILMNPWENRWILSGHDVCFTKKTHNILFSLGRCIPVVRGDGVKQIGVDFIIDILNNGGWMHIFPEGGVNEEKTNKRFKWGIGYILNNIKMKHPLVLPLYHKDFDHVLPNQKPYRLQMGKQVRINIGEVIDMKEYLERMEEEYPEEIERRKMITTYLQHRMYSLSKF
ncbi:hypothetical protein SNEBB_009096 [Seison nebaliae]|nr:hypothetical protein SNEBB_009096 [Seison nebaliae]